MSRNADPAQHVWRVRTYVLGVSAVRSTGRSAVITALALEDGFVRARISRPLQIVLITSMRQSSSSVSHCESIHARRPTAHAARRVRASVQDAVSVSRLLGHSSPTVTLNIYSHAIPKERAGITERLANMFSVSLGSKVVAAGSKLL